MYLKRIELNGFKSFADKTTLEFPAPHAGKFAITSIVGPNGSGKSNVSDAIRWVLGEQSLKQLRGKKNQDIIFSGSAEKGQLGMASVSLFFDNSDQKIPIDYEEVVITRKIYRSGENEYLVNGKRVRLVDFQLLLAKAQFGNNSYGIVSQGLIDKFLFQSPDERKVFFDEAAGIKEFQIRRHQADLRLKKTEENINQAEMLLGEISPRLKILNNQVRKLEKRQELEKTLLDLQEGFYAGLWTNNKREIDRLINDVGILDNKHKNCENELLSIQTELAEFAREKDRSSAFREIEEEYAKALKEKNDIEREKTILEGRMSVEYGKMGEGQLGWLHGKIDELKTQSSQIEREKEQLEKKIQKLKEDLSQKQVEFGENEQRILELRQKIDKSYSSQNDAGFNPAFNAVLNILENREQFGLIYGAVSELGEVDDEYVLALDIAAGGKLSSVVVKDDRIAKNCIEYLRRQKLGTATFLPLNKIKGFQIYDDLYKFLDYEGVLGFAIELVSFDEQFQDIFSYVFGDTLVVEDLESARGVGIGKIRMVTLEGDLLEKSGSMRGGYVNKKRGLFSFAGQKNNYKSIDNANLLREELERLENKQSNLNHNTNEVYSELRVGESKLQAVQEDERTILRELSGLEQELAFNSGSGKDLGNLMQEMKIKKVIYDKTLNNLETKILEIREKIDLFNNTEEEKKKKIFALQDEMSYKQIDLNKISEERNNKRVELAKMETKQEDLEFEIKTETNETIDLILKKEPNKFMGAEVEEAREEIQKLKYKLSLIGGIDENVVEEYEEVFKKHESLNLTLEDLNKAMKDLNKLITELDDLMKKKRKKMFKEIQKEFSGYFKLLFGGGAADLVEVYGFEKEAEEGEVEDELQDKGKKILKGIDILACPPGKKIKHMESLSGGERTMTSIALICAVLRVNPCPFIVLDEVEAALDEANSGRFTDILEDLSRRSQCILVTHNRATMHSSDLLYGIIMDGKGVSRLVSVKLEKQ